MAYYDMKSKTQRLERSNEKLELQINKLKSELEKAKTIVEMDKWARHYQLTFICELYDIVY